MPLKPLGENNTENNTTTLANKVRVLPWELLSKNILQPFRLAAVSGCDGRAFLVARRDPSMERPRFFLGGRHKSAKGLKLSGLNTENKLRKWLGTTKNNFRQVI